MLVQFWNLNLDIICKQYLIENVFTFNLYFLRSQFSCLSCNHFFQLTSIFVLVSSYWRHGRLLQSTLKRGQSLASFVKLSILLSAVISEFGCYFMFSQLICTLCFFCRDLNRHESASKRKARILKMLGFISQAEVGNTNTEQDEKLPSRLCLTS